MKMASSEMSRTKGTFKIFIGRLNPLTKTEDLQHLFENYGTVVECVVVKNYGFVHMENETAGMEAIKNLNNVVLNGSQIKVEASKARKAPATGSATIKIFVGNLPTNVRPNEIKDLFSRYGTVIECDLVHNYGFVHIDTSDVTKLLNELNGYKINGTPIKVQISTSRVRQRPGMGIPQQSYNVPNYGSTQMRSVMPTTASTYGESVNIPRSIYAREVYQPPLPPPPTTATAYLPTNNVYSYSVPPAIHDPHVKMPEIYDNYYDPSLRAAAAAVSTATGQTACYDDYTQTLAVRQDMLNRNALNVHSVPAAPQNEYDIYASNTSSNSIQYTHTQDGHAVPPLPTTAPPPPPIYDGYGTCAPTATYDYLDGRIGTTAGVYDDYMTTNAQVPTLPPLPADPYDTDRRMRTQTSTASRYTPY